MGLDSAWTSSAVWIEKEGMLNIVYPFGVQLKRMGQRIEVGLLDFCLAQFCIFVLGGGTKEFGNMRRVEFGEVPICLGQFCSLDCIKLLSHIQRMLNNLGLGEGSCRFRKDGGGSGGGCISAWDISVV